MVDGHPRRSRKEDKGAAHIEVKGTGYRNQSLHFAKTQNRRATPKGNRAARAEVQIKIQPLHRLNQQDHQWRI